MPYWVWEDEVAGFSSEQTTPFRIEPDPETHMLPAVVSILNTSEQETGSLTIEKSAPGAGRSFLFTVTLTGDKISGTQKFGDVAFNEGVGTFTLADGDSVVISGIPVGTAYSVVESNSYGYQPTWTGATSGIITEDLKDLSLFCTNTLPPPPPREYVDLTVTKSVTGHYSNANPFTFTASFSGLDLYADYNYTVAGVSGSFTASETGEAYVTFALADGESAIFLQIPEYARYQISEDGGDWTASYLVTDSAGGSSIVSTGGSAGTGKPLNTALETADRGEAITIAYTNVLEKTEDISIKKVLVVPEGEEAPDNDSFTFTVNFEGLTPGAYYNSDVGTIRADADGVAERSFSLKAGEQFFFYGLPVGATYRFTEAAGPYIAAFAVADEKGGTTIVEPDGANTKSRTDLATGTETVDEGESIVVTFTNTPVPLRDIDVQKIWNDANDQDGMRPKSIDVQLTANGKALGSPVTLTRSMGWAYTWTDLDKLDEAGAEITYAVEELTISKDTTATNGKYTTATTGDMTEGFTITNTHEPEKTSVPVRKVWNDANNQDGKRPESVTVVLLADGKEVGKKLVLRKANQWSGVFENLPKYSEGKEIVYTVREESVSGYTVAITGDAAEGYEVTNTHDPETTTIGGRKIWKDNNNLNQIRPDSVTVRLRADGQEIASAVVSAQTNWSYSFKDLPVYKNGAKIVYTVSEDAVPGYTTKILDNYNIENSYTPGKTGVNVTKVWDDKNDKDHMRPLEIKVQLLADGKKFGDPAVLNAANKWTYSWTDLDDSKDGVAITYTVREISVKGYTTELTGSAATGFVLINHHTVVPEIEILVRKVWDDQSNRDRIRPSEIRVQLLANGRRVGNPVSLNATNKWSYIWTGLPESQDGKVIVYTVRETAVRGYTAELSGSAATGFVLINHHTPGVIPRPGIIPRTGETNLLPVTIPAMGVSGLGMILSAIFGKKRKSRKNK